MSRRQSSGWWSVRVELLGGGIVGDLWPRPGRILAVSPAHTFGVLAEAIDDAFARWDQFELPKLDKTVTEFRYIDDIDLARSGSDVGPVLAMLARRTLRRGPRGSPR